MNVFLIEGASHYVNIISQQVTHRELIEYPPNKELAEKQTALASACCKTRLEILRDLNDSFEELVDKITTEDTEIANKIAEACNCKEILFTCTDERNNVKKEIRYEKQE